MRRFGTQGPVNVKDNYVVARREELADFVNRVNQGRYIVLFAPRQTGKTTFFQDALKLLTADGETYFPIQLNFEEYEDATPTDFYHSLCKDICKEIRKGFHARNAPVSPELDSFLTNARLGIHLTKKRIPVK